MSEQRTFLLHMLLGRAEPSCICNFTKVNQHTDLQILTHNFAVIPDFKQTQIMTFKEQNRCTQLDLAQPILNHSMIIHFRSHDPDPTLNSRCMKYFRSNHQHSSCNIKYTLDRSIPQKPFSLAHLGLMIFSSLYSFKPFSIPRTKTTQDSWYSWAESNNRYSAQYCGLILWY